MPDPQRWEATKFDRRAKITHMNPYLLLIIAILFAEYALDNLVNILNLRALSTKLPEEFRGVYDDEKYSKSQEYLRANTHFHLFSEGVRFAATLAFLFAGGFALLDQLVRSFGFGEIASGLCYIGSLILLTSLLGLPFSLYHTFVIEQRFGFNRTTWKTFCLDLLKALVLGALIGGGVLALVLWFFEVAGAHAWIYAWAGLMVIQIILLFLAPAFLMPLFNKFDPLPDGELKQAIEAFAKKLDFRVSGLFTMDGSKRSSKANAYFTGFGKFRRIVLFDTLIANHSVEELVAVLAHEIGHYKLRHILKMLLFSALSTGLMFYFLSLLVGNEGLFAAFGMGHISVYASLVFVGMLFSPVSKLFSILSQTLSRKHEFEADAFAAEFYGKPELLVSALKKLSVENLSNLSPHPWKVFLEYSHPPVLERIQALREFRAEH